MLRRNEGTTRMIRTAIPTPMGMAKRPKSSGPKANSIDVSSSRRLTVAVSSRRPPGRPTRDKTGGQRSAATPWLGGVDAFVIQDNLGVANLRLTLARAPLGGLAPKHAARFQGHYPHPVPDDIIDLTPA